MARGRGVVGVGEGGQGQVSNEKERVVRERGWEGGGTGRGREEGVDPQSKQSSATCKPRNSPAWADNVEGVAARGCQPECREVARPGEGGKQEESEVAGGQREALDYLLLRVHALHPARDSAPARTLHQRTFLTLLRLSGSPGEVNYTCTAGRGIQGLGVPCGSLPVHS